MKKLLFVCCTLSILFAISSFKCKSDSSTDCETAICTQIFASVGVHIEDLSMTAMGFTVYTLRNSTGEKLTFTQNGAAQGNYIVLDDSYRAKIAGRTETFTLVGMKSGTQYFTATYQIKADCCHVSKVSGKDSLTVPIH